MTLSFEDELVRSRDFISLKWRDKTGEVNVYKIRETISPVWRDLGEVFGFSSSLLVSIERRCHRDPEKCFDEVIYQWQRNGSDPPEMYPVTWGGLIQALRDLGNVSNVVKRLSLALKNRVEEEAYREDELVRSRDFNSLKWRDVSGKVNVYKLREPFAPYWKDLGKMFGFHGGLLVSIERRCHGDPEKCFDEVIYQWQSDGSDPPEMYPVTWGGLIRALRDLGTVHNEVKRLSLALRNRVEEEAYREGFLSTFSHLQPVRSVLLVLVAILVFLLGVVLSVRKGATDATGTSSSASHQHPVASVEGLWEGGGVFASTAFVYVGKAKEYSFLGFKMKAPANALPDSVTEISFLIEAVPPSKLQIPEDTLLVSGLYRIRSSHAFRKPATIYIQHCVDLDSTPLLTNHLSFFISKDQHFQLLDGGEFNATEIENYGSIERTDFCFFGILLNAISKLFPLRPIRYMAHLYEGAFYTITRDLEAEEKAARAQMNVQHDAVHILLAIKFTDPGDDAEIFLDFPDHEECIIHHDRYPAITRQQVDDFVAGVTTLPRVKLDLQWRGNSSLVENRIRIELKGAKPPRNYFNVECTIHLSSASATAAAAAVKTVSSAQPEALTEEPKCHEIESKKELRDAVSEIGNWFELCSNLGVKEATMNGLENSLKQDTFKKTECLSAYVDQGEACWEEVVKVISEHPFFNNRVASVIRDKYCTDKP